MKKVILIFCGLVFTNCMFAQKQKKVFKNNEVSLDLLTTIATKFPSASYERILSEDTGVGVAILFDNTTSDKFGFMMMPHFSWYFNGSSESAKKYASGFFLEANGLIASFNQSESLFNNNEEHYRTSNTSSNKGFTTGLGLGLGWKLVSKNNWVAKIGLRFGRNLNHDGGYGHFGLSIGKRF